VNKQLKAIADQLREARDLMNHGGKHWIKGAESMIVAPDHEPGGVGIVNRYYYPLGEEAEIGFCSVGALREVSADTIATITLAEVIDPEMMRNMREQLAVDARSEYRGYSSWMDDYDEETYVEEYVYDRLTDEAESVIIGFNDGDSSWDDVRGAFTKAAKRLSDRARRKSS
jgi:hypothetical protein